MTTRADMLKKISKAAKKAGLNWEFVREGGNHSIYKLDGMQIAIGRHKQRRGGQPLRRDCVQGVRREAGEGLVAMKEITARLSRDGKFWLVYVPEIKQHTQGRSIKEAREMAVDLTATWLDIPLEEVTLTHTVIELPDQAQQLVEQAERERADAERANHAAALSISAAASALQEQGLTVRDIGEALGVSFQRAHQLLQRQRDYKLAAGR